MTTSLTGLNTVWACVSVQEMAFRQFRPSADGFMFTTARGERESTGNKRNSIGFPHTERTHPAVGAGYHGISHPGAKAGPRGSHGDRATDCSQTTATCEQRGFISGEISRKDEIKTPVFTLEKLCEGQRSAAATQFTYKGNFWQFADIRD